MGRGTFHLEWRRRGPESSSLKPGTRKGNRREGFFEVGSRSVGLSPSLFSSLHLSLSLSLSLSFTAQGAHNGEDEEEEERRGGKLDGICTVSYKTCGIQKLQKAQQLSMYRMLCGIERLNSMSQRFIMFSV